MAILLIFLGYNLAAIHKRYNVTAKDNALWLLQHFCSLFLKCSLGLGFFFYGFVFVNLSPSIGEICVFELSSKVQQLMASQCLYLTSC